MRSVYPFSVLALLLVILSSPGCDSPSSTAPVPEFPVDYFFGPYTVFPEQSLPGGSTFVMRISADDLDREWVYRVPAEEATGKTVLTLPEGSDRLVRVRVVSAGGDTLYAGSRVTALHTSVVTGVVMDSVPGSGATASHVGVQLGQVGIRVEGGESGSVELGGTLQLEAIVFRPDDSPMDVKVTWASNRLNVAHVDEDGLVHGNSIGGVEIVAVYDGRAVSVPLIVKEARQLVMDTIGHSLRLWQQGNGDLGGPGFSFSGISFQHSSWGCSADIHLSAIPRQGITNDADSESCKTLAQPWQSSYLALEAVAWGLGRLDSDPDLEASFTTAELARLRAMGRFVQGLAHATIALHYDRGHVLDEGTETADPPPLIGYSQLIAGALARLSEAADIAQGASFTFPADWFGGVETPSAEVPGIVHGLRARLLSAVARTPAERAAVNWAAVLTELNAASPWYMALEPFDYDGWTMDIRYYFAYANWQQLTYWVLGMADTSGTYQKWVQVPIGDRLPEIDDAPFLISTPDQRFAQGATLEEQTADSHDRQPRYGIPPFALINNFQRPERGTWRWSYYWTYDLLNHFEESLWPEISQAELDLLRAEALYRLAGNAPTAEAAALVDTYRTAAGLDPSGDGNDDCVPRLPDGTCGDFFEMLKWEKRIETQYRGLYGAPWFFEGRGWGDLYEGSILHLPIPCAEAEARGLPCTNFGGVGGEAAATLSSYGWETLF